MSFPAKNLPDAEILEILRNVPDDSELSENNSDDDDDNSIEEANFEKQEYVSSSDSSSDESADIIVDNLETDSTYEISADKTKWNAMVQQKLSGRIPARNIMRKQPGPTTYAKRRITDEVSSAFRLIIDDYILKYIQNCTETEARQRLGNNSWSLSVNELEAFIAVLYARGALGAKNLSVSHIFSTKFGPELIRQTMSGDRFKEIMKYIRFDVKNTRSERLQNDKFALASTIWDRFIENSKACYIPGTNITIDEQLFPSKARCPFIQYIANKPDKFGIKFWLAVDVDSKYILNGYPYTGKDDQRPSDVSASEQVVLRLMEPFYGNEHNVTCDNYFTSPNLVSKLKLKNTTLVGTANKNRKWLPGTAKNKKSGLQLHETRVFVGPNSSILTVYQCKKNKSVSILSSLHTTVKINDNTKKKPDTIEFYNSTKYGVDVADSMAKMYSVKGSSRRWPVHVFYNILDLAAINSWVLYKETTGSKISRLNFLLQLSEDLRKAHVSTHDQSSGSVPAKIQRLSSIQKPPEIPRQCQMKACRNKSIAKICYQCSKRICGTCTANVKRWCSDCNFTQNE